AIPGQRREPLAVAVGAGVRPVKPADPVELTPAPLGVAALLGEGGEVRPRVGGQWADVEGAVRHPPDRNERRRQRLSGMGPAATAGERPRRSFAPANPPRTNMPNAGPAPHGVA